MNQNKHVHCTGKTKKKNKKYTILLEIKCRLKLKCYHTLDTQSVTSHRSKNIHYFVSARKLNTPSPGGRLYNYKNKTYVICSLRRLPRKTATFRNRNPLDVQDNSNPQWGARKVDETPLLVFVLLRACSTRWYYFCW